ncbi:hypothetical protein SteCoe_30488 [Stentor coeruleus]|uniref:Uncharacterized protein n=1 Tax=Stentor coeruleus TaxID=5963 RepID=A0A1R2B3L4_9CILI|nr:hypothetical protein SteCoe_30488 [Stentor coeruleus]
MYGNVKPENMAKNISINYCFAPFAPKYVIGKSGHDYYNGLLQIAAEHHKNFEFHPSVATEVDDSNYLKSSPHLPILSSASVTSKKEFLSILDFSSITEQLKSSKPEIVFKGKLKPSHFSKLVTLQKRNHEKFKEFIIKTKPLVQKKLEYPVNSEETMKVCRNSLKHQDTDTNSSNKLKCKSSSPCKKLRTFTPIAKHYENFKKKKSLMPIHLPRIKKKSPQPKLEHFRCISAKDTITPVTIPEDIDLTGW